MEWISVKDKLPEKERAVLIYVNNGYQVAWWYGEDKDFYYKPRGPISDLISEMVQGFHWTHSQAVLEHFDKTRHTVNFYQEDYDKIYWMYLPEKPK